jgi:serine/threonine-protein kinase
MNPVGMFIGRARGVAEFDSATVFVMHYPDYLLVGVSVVISVVMTRLSRQVATAREMGSYRLVSLLGTGGMGEVWRARHRMLARDAAIKLIKPDMLSAQSGKNALMLVRRFEQEAKSTAALRSPHTVALYDFGVTADNTFYYVMELLDGIDLETVVKKFGPLPPGRVVSILRQVCQSLGEAHRRQMVHRDVKASNIYLCRMGSEVDYVKVLDFGLVKVHEPEQTRLTLIGAITGTPAYMAPEVAMGLPDIDGRADIYALGCVAYWLVTGKHVFEETGGPAMILAHANKLPIRPSERTSLHIPQTLERIIMMCLAKDRADRPANAEALQHMLDTAIDIDSWSAQDAEDWWRTHVPENIETTIDSTTRTGQDSFTTV